VVGSCEYGGQPSGSGAAELVSYLDKYSASYVILTIHAINYI
jgi:hypothetical protein